jgi:hypothetical protein
MCRNCSMGDNYHKEEVEAEEDNPPLYLIQVG